MFSNDPGEIIRLYRQGIITKKQAFTDVTQLVAGPVYDYIYKRCHSKEDADDLFQDVMQAFFEKEDNYRDHFPLIPYLYRIAQHKIIDMWRRRTSQLSLIRNFSQIHAPYYDGGWAATDAKILVDKLTSQLPEKVATVMLQQENAMEDIAKMNGVPISTVKSQLRIAKKALRDNLEKGGTIADEEQ